MYGLLGASFRIVTSGSRIPHYGFHHLLRQAFLTITLAGVAQLVEQLICNHQVVGSSPITGSSVTSFNSCI